MKQPGELADLHPDKKPVQGDVQLAVEPAEQLRAQGAVQAGAEGAGQLRVQLWFKPDGLPRADARIKKGNRPARRLGRGIRSAQEYEPGRADRRARSEADKVDAGREPGQIQWYP